MAEARAVKSENFFESNFATTSFATQSLKYLLSSNIFFPSNMKEREVKDLGSIRESVDVLETDICKTVAIERSLLAKSGRCIARAGASAGISMVIAPIGVIWHTCLLSIHGILYYHNKENHHYEQITLAAYALFADSTLTLFGLVCPLILLKGGIANNSFARIALPAALVFPLLLGALPQQVPRLFFQKSLRTPFYKSILLKNTYGIVGEKGKLLSWDLKKDQEYLQVAKGHFGDIFLQQGLKYLTILQELKISGVKIHNLYPPNTEHIINDIWRSNIPNKEAHIEELKKCDKNIKSMRDLLRLFLEMQENSVLHYYFGIQSTLQIPKFPIPRADFESVFRTRQGSFPREPKAPPLTDWQRALNEARAVVSKNHEGPNARYIEYKSRIFIKNTPHGLFNLSKSFSKKDLRKAYLRLVLTFHPDKVPSAYKQESEELFKIYGTTHTILLKELAEKSKRRNW